MAEVHNRLAGLRQIFFRQRVKLSVNLLHQSGAAKHKHLLGRGVGTVADESREKALKTMVFLSTNRKIPAQTGKSAHGLEKCRHKPENRRTGAENAPTNTKMPRTNHFFSAQTGKRLAQAESLPAGIEKSSHEPEGGRTE
jgi:hypothetical protein